MSTPKKKVCLVTPEFPPLQFGGLARTVARVAAHLAMVGLDVHVAQAMISEGRPPLLDENRLTEKQGNITVHMLSLGRETFPDGQRTLWDCPHTLTLLMLFESLEVLDRQEDFDAFVSFFLYPMGYVTGLLARRKSVPHVAGIVGNDIKKYVFSPEKSALCKSGLDNADRIVFLSRDLMEMAQALTPVKDKATIIFNSVSPSPLTWAGPPEGQAFRIGCAGIFKHAKGLPYLIKGLAMLRQTGPATLELAGQVRPDEVPLLEFWLNKAGVREAVQLPGVVPHEKMPHWLARLHAFALPSVSEGCPNVLMEAMALGLPCVATRVGANEILMDDGVSGLLVPYGDSEALAIALTRIRADQDLADSLGRAARLRMKNFSPERERRAWAEVVRQVLDFS